MNPEVQLIFDFMLLTPGQRIAFAIRCAMAVYQEERFVQWANGWLSGSDRSREAAHDAWGVAWGTAWGTTAWAAERAATRAAHAAWDAAQAWDEAADWAIKVNPNLNLTAIAEKVMATHKEEE